ncbi:hypothetical protein [Acinetobacter sp. ANC 3791]|uniref:hypothetical protein n=1 Tax=Acinetobacter sp. ANC 3791 TaxID=2529836 RepID=UPI00103A7403|nr:hypothetical protein [Acinetobacter sp. ANC 3791]TCB83107.1 hypothetical protein E0H90_12390 [Acinetobacter sp. ANC 3791]
MQLIEIKPHYWELYKDDEGIYLNVIINVRITSFEKTIILDKEAIQGYITRGKEFIDGLAKRIESSHFRNDYYRFYSYPDVSKEQNNKMNEAFKLWASSLDEPYEPYI